VLIRMGYLKSVGKDCCFGLGLGGVCKADRAMKERLGMGGNVRQNLLGHLKGRRNLKKEWGRYERSANRLGVARRPRVGRIGSNISRTYKEEIGGDLQKGEKNSRTLGGGKLSAPTHQDQARE